ncbi:hypothetical protein CALCODRAFT_512587 [Calocera cornea HHB12733]|uniref:Uncharacterized protein n=1 Tax=Calocera cornea HHB12733 TaxID=1353952 RepID=A0A165CXJ5_9BASI|nr:hypothetical protein CALCODRAFT_512587 [Calocera cornea HHB12733]
MRQTAELMRQTAELMRHEQHLNWTSAFSDPGPPFTFTAAGAEGLPLCVAFPDFPRAPVSAPKGTHAPLAQSVRPHSHRGSLPIASAAYPGGFRGLPGLTLAREARKARSCSASASSDGGIENSSFSESARMSMYRTLLCGCTELPIRVMWTGPLCPSTDVYERLPPRVPDLVNRCRTVSNVRRTLAHYGPLVIFSLCNCDMETARSDSPPIGPTFWARLQTVTSTIFAGAALPYPESPRLGWFREQLPMKARVCRDLARLLQHPRSPRRVGVTWSMLPGGKVAIVVVDVAHATTSVHAAEHFEDSMVTPFGDQQPSPDQHHQKDTNAKIYVPEAVAHSRLKPSSSGYPRVPPTGCVTCDWTVSQSVYHGPAPSQEYAQTKFNDQTASSPNMPGVPGQSICVCSRNENMWSVSAVPRYHDDALTASLHILRSYQILSLLASANQTIEREDVVKYTARIWVQQASNTILDLFSMYTIPLPDLLRRWVTECAASALDSTAQSRRSKQQSVLFSRKLPAALASYGGGQYADLLHAESANPIKSISYIGAGNWSVWASLLADVLEGAAASCSRLIKHDSTEVTLLPEVFKWELQHYSQSLSILTYLLDGESVAKRGILSPRDAIYKLLRTGGLSPMRLPISRELTVLDRHCFGEWKTATSKHGTSLRRSVRPLPHIEGTPTGDQIERWILPVVECDLQSQRAPYGNTALHHDEPSGIVTPWQGFGLTDETEETLLQTLTASVELFTLHSSRGLVGASPPVENNVRYLTGASRDRGVEKTSVYFVKRLREARVLDKVLFSIFPVHDRNIRAEQKDRPVEVGNISIHTCRNPASTDNIILLNPIDEALPYMTSKHRAKCNTQHIRHTSYQKYNSTMAGLRLEGLCASKGHNRQDNGLCNEDIDSHDWQSFDSPLQGRGTKSSNKAKRQYARTPAGVWACEALIPRTLCPAKGIMVYFDNFEKEWLHERLPIYVLKTQETRDGRAKRYVQALAGEFLVKFPSFRDRKTGLPPDLEEMKRVWLALFHTAFLIHTQILCNWFPNQKQRLSRPPPFRLPSGRERKATSLLSAWEVMASEEPEIVDTISSLASSLKVSPLKIRATVLKTHWESKTPEEQNSYREKAHERVLDYSQPDSNLPVEKIQPLLESFLQEVAKRTGWIFTVLAGGRNRAGGASSLTLFVGDSREGLNFQDYCVNFDQRIKEAWLDYVELQVCPDQYVASQGRRLPPITRALSGVPLLPPVGNLWDRDQLATMLTSFLKSLWEHECMGISFSSEKARQAILDVLGIQCQTDLYAMSSELLSALYVALLGRQAEFQGRGEEFSLFREGSGSSHPASDSRELQMMLEEPLSPLPDESLDDIFGDTGAQMLTQTPTQARRKTPRSARKTFKPGGSLLKLARKSYRLAKLLARVTHS